MVAKMMLQTSQVGKKKSATKKQEKNGFGSQQPMLQARWQKYYVFQIPMENYFQPRILYWAKVLITCEGRKRCSVLKPERY